MNRFNIVSSALIKKNIFSILISPLFYICAILFECICFSVFFIGRQFFVIGVGTSDLTSLFAVIPYISIIVIPTLLLSVNSNICDSTLPVSNFQIVLAKWISAYVCFCVMLIPLFFAVFIVSILGDIDAGQVCAAFIGIVFFAAASFSFAVFIFELIPEASFLITTVLLLFSNCAHIVPLFFNLTGITDRIIRAFSFLWHFDSARKGIVDSRDIVFFVITAVFFIISSVLIIEKKREKKDLFKPFVLLCILTALSFLNNNRFYVRMDLTTDNKYTVSNYSKRLLKNVEQPLRIVFYRSSELERLYPQVKNISDFLIEYSNYSEKVSYRFFDVNQNDKAIKDKLSSYGLQSQQLKIAQGENQYIDVYSSIIIEYLDKYEVIPFILSSESIEYDIDGRIDSLVNGTKREVYLICGNGLNVLQDYSYVIPWLESQGFVCTLVDQTNMYSVINSINIPILLLGSSQLSEEESAFLEFFILQGGKVFANVSPYSVDLKNTWNVTKNDDNFLKVLSKFGFDFQSNLVVSSDCSSILMYSENNERQQIDYPYWIHLLPQQFAKNGITMFWSSSMLLESNQILPILFSSNKSWEIKESLSDDTYFETNPFLATNYLQKKNGSNNIDSSFVVGAKFSGVGTGFYTGIESNKCNVIVLADQYFVNSLLLGYSGGELGDYRNLQVLTNWLLILQDEQDLATLQNRNFVNQSLYNLNYENVANYRSLTLFIMFVGIPVLFVVLGFVVIIRRKNRR